MPRRTARPSPAALALLVSVGAHGLLLFLGAGTVPGGGTGRPATGTAAPLQVQLNGRAPEPEPAPEREPEHAQEVKNAPLPTATTAPRPIESAPAPTVQPSADATTQGALPLATPEPGPRGPQGLVGFLGIRELSQAPYPRVQIPLDKLPELKLLSGPGSMLLTLWIDAQGQVVAYRADAPDLPEEYTSAVARAFASARFVPGYKDGQAVKSMLKIRVEHAVEEEHQDMQKKAVIQVAPHAID